MSKKQITAEEFNWLKEKIWLEFLENASQIDLLKSIVTSNWDGNKFLLNWIKDNPKVDKGVILSAYWRCAPRWNKQFFDREDLIKKEDWNLENFDYTEDLENKFINGFYSEGEIYFDPKSDYTGDDWTSDYLDLDLVRDIPEVMTKPTNGNNTLIEEPEDFDEGLPMKPIDYAQKVYDLFDEYEIIDKK